MTVQWIDFRDPVDGWLLFRYDPTRHVIQIQRRGRKTTIDLADADRQTASNRQASVIDARPNVAV